MKPSQANKVPAGKSPLRFLWGSLAALLALCVGVFACLTSYMVESSETAIREVGTIYMSQMSAQLKLHFSLLVDLRLSQLEGALEQALPAGGGSEAIAQRLHALGEDHSFSSVGLYTPEGELIPLYGEAAEVLDEASFRAALARGERKVAAGRTQSGESLLLLSAPAACELPDGRAACAAVAALPMEYLQKALSLDVSDTLVYSHIIREDGTFILRSGDATEASYFDRVLEKGEVSGLSAREAVESMVAAVARGEDFSLLVTIEGARRNAYLTPLPYSDWYLVSTMPYETLEGPIARMGDQRTASTLVACGLILLSLLAIFYQYYRLSRRQMAALEEARRKADSANRSKSAFLSNMSHDIRTPMNAIVGMTAIASANVERPEQVKDCLSKIALSSKQLLGLINDVLDMSKIESGKLQLCPEPLSLREAMEGVVGIVQPQAKARGQRFDVIVGDMVAEDVLCDGVRLNQVLLNLLSNAVKFTPEGGEITLTLRQERAEGGRVRTRFSVKDTGIGMSQAFTEKIFEVFERENTSRVNRTEGTGLGMAITKYIVDAMGGSIQVKSEIGRGSEFVVTIDLERAACGVEAAAPAAQSPDLNGRRILLAEDNDLNWEIADTLLSAYGPAIERAQDGQVCVDMFASSAPGYYDAILMDIRMPVMDGYEAARAIRALDRPDAGLPIIAMTADAFSEDIRRCAACGMDGHIAKPIDADDVVRALQKHLPARP